jgi:hypothetical protein
VLETFLGLHLFLHSVHFRGTFYNTVPCYEKKLTRTWGQCWDKNVSFGSGSTKQQIRIAAPAPTLTQALASDSFIRPLKLGTFLRGLMHIFYPYRVKIVTIYKYFFSNHFFKSLINRKELEPEDNLILAPRFSAPALALAPAPQHWGDRGAIPLLNTKLITSALLPASCHAVHTKPTFTLQTPKCQHQNK